MSSNKTQPHDGDVKAFIASLENETRQADAYTALDLFSEESGEGAKMWGPSIIGFGQYHYVYDSGREGDFMLTGFSPRKQNMSIYNVPGFDKYTSLLERLGKHKTGRSCLYVNKLADLDLDVLRELVRTSVADMRKKYPPE